MSSWTLDAFDNPAARDWVAEIVHTRDLSLVEEALTLVVDTADAYLEKDDAERAMAALEVLAAVLSRPSSLFLDQNELVKWLAIVKPSADIEMIRLGRKALVRILASDSELREHWEDSDEFDAWLAEVYELRERVSP
jgi:hypothetical protein